MRVVAGKWGGRVLRAPRGLTVRPTGDRVREAVFGILGDRVEGASVLDLFAGTGAMALEALSRGAAGAVLVESSPEALEVAGRNVQRHRVANITLLAGSWYEPSAAVRV